MRTYFIYKNGEVVSEIEGKDHSVDGASGLLNIYDDKGSTKAVFKKWDGFEIEQEPEELDEFEQELEDIQNSFPEIKNSMARRMARMISK